MFLLSYTFSEYCSNQQSAQQLEWSITANCRAGEWMNPGLNAYVAWLSYKLFGCYLKSEPLPEPSRLLGESWDHHSVSIWGFSTTLKGISAVLWRCPTIRTLSKLCPLVRIRLKKDIGSLGQSLNNPPQHLVHIQILARLFWHSTIRESQRYSCWQHLWRLDSCPTVPGATMVELHIDRNDSAFSAALEGCTSVSGHCPDAEALVLPATGAGVN